MRIEDQVCTFDQAKKLDKYLPRPYDSLFRYYEINSNGVGHLGSKLHDIFPDDQVEKFDNGSVSAYAAYTVAELGVLLPSSIIVSSVKYYQKTKKIDHRFQCFYHKAFHDSFGPNGFVPHRDWYQAEAEARAAALIWLIENGYVKVEDLKL